MMEPGANARPDNVSALDPDARSMLRALLLCELIEQIDMAAATKAGTTLTSAQTEPERVAALTTMLEIRYALDRLDDGTYGICERCSKTIALSELQEHPKGRLCRVCSPRSCPPRRLVWRRMSLRTWSGPTRPRSVP